MINKKAKDFVTSSYYLKVLNSPNNDTVALEAECKRGSIKKSGHATLIEAIK